MVSSLLVGSKSLPFTVQKNSTNSLHHDSCTYLQQRSLLTLLAALANLLGLLWDEWTNKRIEIDPLVFTFPFQIPGLQFQALNI